MQSQKTSGESDEILVEVKGLHVWFPVRDGFISSIISKHRNYVRAIDGVGFQIRRGEIFCLVGESGSGKTTLAKTLVGLIKPTSGKVLYNGTDLGALIKEDTRRVRREIQMVFQDPYESLNPYMTVFDIVAEPLEVNHLVKGIIQKENLVSEALRAVELTPPESFFDKYPHQLSGGQRQRVALAATLVLRPKLVVADEPLSMLDASVRAELLKLMIDLRNKLDLTYLFITHDLAIAQQIGDRIAVMYLGKIMEGGNAREVMKTPLNPYTEALVSVAPVLNPKILSTKILLKGEVPSAVDIPSGCRFHTRCPMTERICREQEPDLREITQGHYSACHLAERLAKAT